jgi:hypothetical protein
MKRGLLGADQPPPIYRVRRLGKSNVSADLSCVDQPFANIAIHFPEVKLFLFLIRTPSKRNNR